MVSLREKYDATFLGILQNEGKIPPFLDSIFSFLYRKTDFFRLMKTPEDKMGFPPGIALKLVKEAFKRYEDLARRDEAERARRQQEAEDRLKQAHVTDLEDVSPVVKEVDVTTSTHAEICDTKQTNKQNTTSKTENIKKPNDRSKNETKVDKNTASKVSNTKTVDNPNNVPIEQGNNLSSQSSGDGQTKEGQGDVKSNEEEDDNPELTKLQKVFQANPESYNGAVRDNYSWSQSITDVDVRIHVPLHIKRGKEVKVAIKRKHLSASCLCGDGKMEEVLNGDLPWDINQEESMWTLVPGEHIHVNLEKVQERWWDSLLTDEPKISVRKIDPSRPMTDLDDEAQAKIQEMMWNDHRKKMGLPQSHEVKMHGMLKDAWDAEGSPFKGQPFDPSKLNISAPGQGGMLQ